MNYAQPFKRSSEAVGTRTSANILADARDNTEFGLLRTFVNINMSRRTGSETSSVANRLGLNYAAGTSSGQADGSGTAGRQMQTAYTAYVQLGGFTIGHMGSFYNQNSAPNANIGIDGWDQRDQAHTVAYTFSLGNGMTLTGALEDNLANRMGVFNSNTTFTASSGAATAVTPYVIDGTNRLPDYIASFMVDQAWGKVVLSGAVHSINVQQGGTLTAPNNGGAYTAAGAVATQYGYAGQLSTKINLPMIAAGDYLWASVAYSDGASGFTLRDTPGIAVQSNNATGFGIGRVAVSANDLVINNTTGAIYKAQVWGAAAEIGHYFTPTVMAYLAGSYTALDWDAAAQALNTTVINPANMTRVDLGLVWSPVKGFKITPDVEWAKVNTKVATNYGATGEGAAKKSESAWTGRIKIQRDF